MIFDKVYDNNKYPLTFYIKKRFDNYINKKFFKIRISSIEFII